MSGNHPPLEIVIQLMHYDRMTKVAQIETGLEKLSQAELREVRDWLDDMIEDDLEFSPKFESAIQQSEREMANV